MSAMQVDETPSASTSAGAGAGATTGEQKRFEVKKVRSADAERCALR